VVSVAGGARGGFTTSLASWGHVTRVGNGSRGALLMDWIVAYYSAFACFEKPRAELCDGTLEGRFRVIEVS
jgi:hypothetical protein